MCSPHAANRRTYPIDTRARQLCSPQQQKQSQLPLLQRLWAVVVVQFIARCCTSQPSRTNVSKNPLCKLRISRIFYQQQIQHVRNNSVNARLHAPRLLPALACLAAASLAVACGTGKRGPDLRLQPHLRALYWKPVWDEDRVIAVLQHRLLSAGRAGGRFSAAWRGLAERCSAAAAPNQPAERYEQCAAHIEPGR